MAHGVGPSKLDIVYERIGDPSHPPVLLIMELGAQLDGFCDGLVQLCLHVIFATAPPTNREEAMQSGVTASA